MEIRELKETIIERMLDELPVCKPSGDRTQWYVRCPYCGDSVHQNHGHLSIHIDVDDDRDGMRWRCLKCNESGSVTREFLQDLGLYVEPEFAVDLRNYNRKANRVAGRYLNDYIPTFKIPKPKDSKANYFKRKYLSDRLGWDFSLEDSHTFQIVYDLEQFLSFNGIDPPSLTNPKFRSNLQNNYVGFLSMNRNVITLRCILSKETMEKYKYYRYLKVELDPRNKNPNSFYHIPTPVPLLSKEPLHVHIAEGIFDILGVYFGTTWKKDFPDGNHVFYGACGFGSSQILQNIIYSGLGYNIILHLYCDNDQSDWREIQSLIAHPQIQVWVDKVYFHRNGYENEKDYGVPKDRIINQYRQVDVWKESGYRK